MIDLASPLKLKNKFLVFGGGFSGDYFAKSIRKLGCIALTSSRTEKNDPNNFIFNSEKNLIPEDSIFEGVTHILSCIPPGKDGKDPVLKSLKHKISSLNLNWIGYLSTTGVYGNTHGDWVSENDKPKPFQERSQRRLNCEKEWIDSNLSLIHI